jgi:hypothetical protein
VRPRHEHATAASMESAADYERHRPGETVLYETVQEHWKTFLADLAATAEASALPAFVAAEVEAFLRCEILAHGFVVARCGRKEDIRLELTAPRAERTLLSRGASRGDTAAKSCAEIDRSGNRASFQAGLFLSHSAWERPAQQRFGRWSRCAPLRGKSTIDFLHQAH